MRETFVSTASALLDEEPRLAVVLADISDSEFADSAHRHPRRVINLGIREQLMLGVAGGLAATGMRPIVHSYAPFLVERPFEQIKLDLGHQGLGAVLVGIGGSYEASHAGRTHHAPGDVALLDTLTGWTVHAPGHPEEAETLLRQAVRTDDRVYLRLSGVSNAAPRPVSSPSMDVVRRGTGGTVLAVGPMLDRTLAAAADLDVTVLYAATVRPFDTATMLTTLDAPNVVLVEPYLAGTSIPAVNDALAHVPHRTLGIGVGRGEVRRYGTVAEHDAVHGLDVAGLRGRIRAFLAG